MPLTRIRQTAIGDDSITTAKLDDTTGGFTLPGNQFVRVPVGTTAQRPSSPASGHLRYNTNFNLLEQYNAGLNQWQAIDTPPTITNLSYSGSLTAADPAGGTTITLTGTNFQSGATVTVGGTAASSVTVASSTSITFTTPVKTAGDYDVVVQNSNGLRATLTNGLTINGTPTFTTGATLTPVSSNATISITILATEPDGGTIAYSQTTGTSNPLPGFLSLNAGTGALTGTAPSVSSDTTHTFEITATDNENQTINRTFTLVVNRLYYSHPVPSSMTFSDARSQHLSRTPSGTGNRQIFTLSSWIKKTDVAAESGQGAIFGSGIDANNRDVLRIGTDGLIEYQGIISGTSKSVKTESIIRGHSEWAHVMLVVDTTQSSSANRVKIYLDGQLQTLSGNTGDWHAQNSNTSVNHTCIQLVAARTDDGSGNTLHWDGSLAEVHLVDGSALTPTSFGEDHGGDWKPKAYSGSHGTNGFYLPFRQEGEAGWSVTQHEGTNEPQIITNVGFDPDLVWFKWRDGGSGWEVHDTLREEGHRLLLDTNMADASGINGVTAIVNDGYQLNNSGGGGESNGANRTYVVYHWDAGTGQVQNKKLEALGAVGGILYRGDTFEFTATVTGTYAVSYTGGGDNASASGSTGIGDNMTLFNWGTHELFKNGVSQLTWRGAYLSNTGGSQSYVRQRAAQNGSTTLALAAGDTVKVVLAGSNADLNYGTYYNTYQGAPSITFTSPNNNTSGSINAQVKANPTHGFSIVKYTGTGSAATIGHGLSSAPKWIAIKNLTDAESWAVGHDNIGWDYSMKFDDNSARTSGAAIFNATGPTSTLFSVGTNNRTNSNNDSYIAYVWSEVTGYSKFGTYSGSGSAGQAIALGFRPGLVIIKRYDSTGNWVLFDHLRSPYGRADDALSLDVNDRTYTSADGVVGIDFTSTGFTLQDNHTTRNASGGSYVYMAFKDNATYNFWKDYSSNTNNFESINTGQYRITSDSPTGAF